MKLGTQQTLKIIYVLAWIIFVGVCIEAGGFAFGTLYTLAIHSINARHQFPGVDLSSLFEYGQGYYLVEMLLISLVAFMRAMLFYKIVSLLWGKKLDAVQPFNEIVGRFLFTLSYLALLIGFFSWIGAQYSQWLTDRGVRLPDLQSLRLTGADVWLFMGITLFAIAQIFKRGIEIQTENDLTI